MWCTLSCRVTRIYDMCTCMCTSSVAALAKFENYNCAFSALISILDTLYTDTLSPDSCSVGDKWKISFWSQSETKLTLLQVQTIVLKEKPYYVHHNNNKYYYDSTCILSSTFENQHSISYNYAMAATHEQGSAHTDRRWSAPTNTQPFFTATQAVFTTTHKSKNIKMLQQICILTKKLRTREATTQTILGRTLDHETEHLVCHKASTHCL